MSGRNTVPVGSGCVCCSHCNNPHTFFHILDRTESITCIQYYCSLSCFFYSPSAPTCIILFFYLLFTRFWLITVLYAIWWYYDYDTPARGGRRVPFLCGLKLWQYMRDYFPIKVRISFWKSSSESLHITLGFCDRGRAIIKIFKWAIDS